MEKNLKKKKIYIYVYLNHFAVHLKLTQHCKSTILSLKKKKKRTSCHQAKAELGDPPWNFPRDEQGPRKRVASWEPPNVASDAGLFVFRPSRHLNRRCLLCRLRPQMPSIAGVFPNFPTLAVFSPHSVT